MSDYNGECGCDECAEIKEKDERLKRAADLLREWRDQFGGKAVYKFSNYMMTGVATASPSDLLRDTNKFLEGK